MTDISFPRSIKFCLLVSILKQVLATQVRPIATQIDHVRVKSR